MLNSPLEILKKKRLESLQGGGATRIEAQHKKGKLTARERIALLLDAGTFEEYDTFVQHQCQDFGMEEKKILGDGVITGWGMIYARPVFVFAKDFTVFGGSLSKMHAQKINKIQDMALSSNTPIIGLFDAGGARIQEGIDALGGYGEVFYRNVKASGKIPQISMIMGPCAGGDVYSPAITDFIFMVEDTSYMFVTGPNVVKSVTNENVSAEELGGVEIHTTRSSVVDRAWSNDIIALMQLRRLMTFLPQSYRDKAPSFTAPHTQSLPSLDWLVPSDPTCSYDVKHLIKKVVDQQDFFEIQPLFAQNIVIGFGRIGGESVGIVANQPLTMAGVLDSDASRKAARFVRFCDCFKIPIVTFIDVPGFLPGTAQEYQGLIKHGAKLLFAYAQATTPRVSIIIRKAYGGAYDVMSSKHLRGDVNYAWPSSEIAVMGVKGVVEVLYRGESDAKEIAKHKEAYEKRFLNPYVAAEKGYIDDVIMPRETKIRLAGALKRLHSKTEHIRNNIPSHANIPL